MNISYDSKYVISQKDVKALAECFIEFSKYGVIEAIHFDEFKS